MANQNEHPDLRALVMGELCSADARRARADIMANPVWREEYHRLEATLAAMRSVPDEEPPRRIAFVSDPVLAPPWWREMFSGWPQMAFASSALLALAIVGHGWITRPTPTPEVATVSAQQIQQIVDQQVEARLKAMAKPAQNVSAAVDPKTVDLKLAALGREIKKSNDQDFAELHQQVYLLRRELANQYRAANEAPMPNPGGSK